MPKLTPIVVYRPATGSDPLTFSLEETRVEPTKEAIAELLQVPAETLRWLDHSDDIIIGAATGALPFSIQVCEQHSITLRGPSALLLLDHNREQPHGDGLDRAIDCSSYGPSVKLPEQELAAIRDTIKPGEGNRELQLMPESISGAFIPFLNHNTASAERVPIIRSMEILQSLRREQEQDLGKNLGVLVLHLNEVMDELPSIGPPVDLPADHWLNSVDPSIFKHEDVSEIKTAVNHAAGEFPPIGAFIFSTFSMYTGALEDYIKISNAPSNADRNDMLRAHAKACFISFVQHLCQLELDLGLTGSAIPIIKEDIRQGK